MIVAQPLAGDFTVLPNDLLRDTSLSFDARALMGWLLSLPRDWTIRLEQVRKHWGCNLARIKRVMGELISAGWVQRRPSRRQADGTWSTGDYAVFNVRQPVQRALPIEDEPEPNDKATPPESEIRTPVAEIASPESAEPESGKRTPYEELSPPSNPPYPPGGGAPALGSNGAENRGSGERQPEPSAGRRPWRSQGCRGAAPPPVPPETAARFERLWAAYPESGRLPSRSPAKRARALALFAALGLPEQEAAIAAAAEETRIRGKHRAQARALHRWLEHGDWGGSAGPGGGESDAPAARNAAGLARALRGELPGPGCTHLVREDAPAGRAWAAHYARFGVQLRWWQLREGMGLYLPAPFPPESVAA